MFSIFHLQGDSHCINDYLEIREGNSTGSVVGSFCGNSLPSNYTSVIGHILWVKFVSDASISGEGFRATFSHCKCKHHSWSGLTSHSWARAAPSYHATNTYWCVWSAVAQETEWVVHLLTNQMVGGSPPALIRVPSVLGNTLNPKLPLMAVLAVCKWCLIEVLQIHTLCECVSVNRCMATFYCDVRWVVIKTRKVQNNYLLFTI